MQYITSWEVERKEKELREKNAPEVYIPWNKLKFLMPHIRTPTDNARITLLKARDETRYKIRGSEADIRKLGMFDALEDGMTIKDALDEIAGLKMDQLKRFLICGYIDWK